jgi:hypothetical protein
VHTFSQQALVNLGREHWREFQPKRYKALQQAGKLEQELQAAANLTLSEMESSRQLGYTQEEAWELSMQNHLLVPPEKGSPQEPLPDNPAYTSLAEVNRMRDQPPPASPSRKPTTS